MNGADRRLLRFDDFELDAGNARLTRAGQPVALTPRAFDVLCVLAEQAGQLVSKDALLDAVWGHRHITESTLKTTIGQLRAALGDEAAKPRYIETVPRRGYRFAARLARAGAQQAVSALAPPVQMVGREAAAATLNQRWAQAQRGDRALVWITGDAGVGKSTLIDAFLRQGNATTVAIGQCAEQYGAGEPYLPLLEALAALSRDSAEFRQLLRTVAPMWLLQLPWLTSEAERSALHRELAGANQARMRREFLELIERFAAAHPLVIVVEDLHWSDEATLQLMDQFARRRESAAVLWIASLRLAQVMAEGQTLARLRQELRLHRLCEEISLGPFTDTELLRYLSSRVPAVSVSARLARALHRHTGGLPLFVANVVDAMLAMGGPQTLAMDEMSHDASVVPDSLAGAVERQLATASPDDQRLLEAASVCGYEFRASILADALGLSLRETIARCDELVRRGYWLRHVAASTLADGAIDSQYAFRHVLYQHVLCQRSAAAQRMEAHRSIAEAMARGRTRGVITPTTEIAFQYERGALMSLAVRNYIEAARHALNQFASTEAIHLTEHALTLLTHLPQPQRSESELELATNRAIACSQLYGMGAPDTRAAVDHAYALVEHLPLTRGPAIALNGLGWYFVGRAEYARAQAAGERIRKVAQLQGDALLRLCSCDLLGVTLPIIGEYGQARAILEEGLATCDALGDAVPEALFIAHPGVMLRINLSLVLHQLGQHVEAQRHMNDALALAARIRHPMATLFATWAAARFAMLRRDLDGVERFLLELETVVRNHELSHGEAQRLWIRGWLEAQRGEPLQGYQRIMEGYAAQQQLGRITGTAEVLGRAAEALLLGGERGRARTVAQQALDLAVRLGERGVVPWLESLIASSDAVPAGS